MTDGGAEFTDVVRAAVRWTLCLNLKVESVTWGRLMSEAFKPFSCVEQKLSGLGNGSEWHFKIRIWICFYLYFIWYSCTEKRMKIFATVDCFKELLKQYEGLRNSWLFIEAMWGFVAPWSPSSGTNLASFLHQAFRVIQKIDVLEKLRGRRLSVSLQFCQELNLYQYFFLILILNWKYIIASF